LRLSSYMFTQNFVKLSAAVYGLSCQHKKTIYGQKLSDGAENNTVDATADSNNVQRAQLTDSSGQ